jgi:2-methylisocitrate lyase-like PEP mutase family enzyme
MNNPQRLKELLARRAAVTVPGAANALFARVIEELGFEAVYVTGAGIANMLLGAPDVGLTTMTEVRDTAAAIAEAVSVPIIVDADTGYGNAVNVQVFPKKCGHFAGKAVIAREEMVQKIKAAVDARHDQSLQIIARTDGYAVEGLERALERAQAYVAAGADATFVEAPTTLEELARIPKALDVPQVANIVFGGKTPDPGREKLAELGFSIVLYANAALQAALKASYDVLSVLKSEGSLRSVADRLASFEERQRTVAKDEWDAREARYRV